ncbi:MAG: hypothetical protein WC980_09940 [Candidatus Brocadiia bacterium]
MKNKNFNIISVVVIAFLIITIIGCQESYAKLENKSQRNFTTFANKGEDDFLLLRCLWQDIDDCIEESEFCAIAKVIITKDEPCLSWNGSPVLVPLKKITKPNIPNDTPKEKSEEILKKYMQELAECPMLEVYPRSLFKREGKLIIQSVIYGNPETKEISFSYLYNDMDIDLHHSPWSFVRSRYDYPGLAHFLYSEPTSIILGKGKGKDAKILNAIGESLGLISPEAIKIWKETVKAPIPTFDEIMKEWKPTENQPYMSYNEQLKAIEIRQQDWLLNSNNQDLLLLSFVRSLHWYYLRANNKGMAFKTFEDAKGSGLNKAIDLVDTLANKGIDTPERRFLAYGIALFMLHEFSEENKFYSQHTIPLLAQLNDNQKQVLIDIASQKFSQITNPKEGIKYMRLISLFIDDLSLGGPFSPFKEIRDKESILFNRAPALKDKLQSIALTFSERFKNNPDYPEWTKWVNKIFPAEKK